VQKGFSFFQNRVIMCAEKSLINPDYGSNRMAFTDIQCGGEGIL
jgi:hypothetical protein